MMPFLSWMILKVWVFWGEPVAGSPKISNALEKSMSSRLALVLLLEALVDLFRERKPSSAGFNKNQDPICSVNRPRPPKSVPHKRPSNCLTKGALNFQD